MNTWAGGRRIRGDTGVETSKALLYLISMGTEDRRQNGAGTVRHEGQGIRHGALQKPWHYGGRALWSESEMSLMHSVPTCGSAGPAFLTYSHQADPLPKGHTSGSASSSSPLVGHSPPSCHPKPPLSGDSHAAHKEHREWVQKRGAVLW